LSKFDRYIPWTAGAVIRSLKATLRIRHVNSDGIAALNARGERYIIAFWHGHILMMIYARFVLPLAAMISQHRDGELIAQTMKRFGTFAARGSTTRGGRAALREMISLAKSGVNLAITPDGPKGPRHVAQMGVVRAAQMTGVPIVPIAFIAKKKSY
jgi:lysophospholipid acyltransferase (LPLAT)-like uncharacterized protein